jgi:hypothetical protein
MYAERLASTSISCQQHDVGSNRIDPFGYFFEVGQHLVGAQNHAVAAAVAKPADDIAGAVPNVPGHHEQVIAYYWRCRQLVGLVVLAGRFLVELFHQRLAGGKEHQEYQECAISFHVVRFELVKKKTQLR